MRLAYFLSLLLKYQEPCIPCFQGTEWSSWVDTGHILGVQRFVLLEQQLKGYLVEVEKKVIRAGWRVRVWRIGLA